jgi:hypothetical protein
VPTLDPYAALGVPRSATREEIARAYRAAVKRSHPDTGARTSPAQMARINEAWRILADPARRARWDREHAVALSPPAWSAPVVRPGPIRPQTVVAPASRMDSGWMVAAVVAAIAVVVGGIMVAIVMVAEAPSRTITYLGDQLRFEYPDTWSLTEADGGPADDATGHRVVAHLTSFSTGADERCLTFSERCRWEGETLPSGGASVQVIAWDFGPPPDPSPTADMLIGGEPAVHAQTIVGGEMLSAWWQLSPPGFPDEWIEVRAEIRGGDLERGRRLAELEALLRTLEFVDGR